MPDIRVTTDGHGARVITAVVRGQRVTRTEVAYEDRVRAATRQAFLARRRAATRQGTPRDARQY